MKTVSIEIDEELAKELCRLYKRRFPSTKVSSKKTKHPFLRQFVEDRIVEEIEFFSDPTTA